MTTDESRELFDYASWATARMFSAAKALTPEQLSAFIESSFPSILGTLAHMVGSEWIWLRRWQGDNPTSIPDWVSQPALDDLETRLAAIEGERASFLGQLTDADLERVVSYRGLDGQTFSHPLGDLLRHVVNHATYHRGQLATMLRQLGHAPPSTDFTRYLREKNNAQGGPHA
jgi:uncharacterized damage-inducible protein DinB